MDNQNYQNKQIIDQLKKLKDFLNNECEVGEQSQSVPPQAQSNIGNRTYLSVKSSKENIRKRPAKNFNNNSLYQHQQFSQNSNLNAESEIECIR